MPKQIIHYDTTRRLYVNTFVKIINEYTHRLQGIVKSKSQEDAVRYGLQYAKDHLEKEGYTFEYTSLIDEPTLNRGEMILL